MLLFNADYESVLHGRKAKFINGDPSPNIERIIEADKKGKTFK